MNDEIKEILISLSSQCKSATGCENSYFKVKHIQQLLDYITNLQQENEIRQQDINNLTYQLAKEKEENERLKELCDKYEEEHNTTFKEWQKDIQANKKAIEILERDYRIKGEDRDLYEALTGVNVWEGNNGFMD